MRHFTIHARECVLSKSFTPRDNRRIPPLRPRWAHMLQRDFPHLIFCINGGIKTLDMALAHLAPVHACSSDSDDSPRSSHQYGSYQGLYVQEDSENVFSAVSLCVCVCVCVYVPRKHVPWSRYYHTVRIQFPAHVHRFHALSHISYCMYLDGGIRMART